MLDHRAPRRWHQVVSADQVDLADTAPGLGGHDLDGPKEETPALGHATSKRPWRRSTSVTASGPEAQLLAWVRLVDDVSLDHAALAMLVDAMPPAVYAVAATPVAVPTVDLTVSFTDAPTANGWVLLHITTRSASGGWCLDDSEVRDSEGRLRARGRQTRHVLGEWT